MSNFFWGGGKREVILFTDLKAMSKWRQRQPILEPIFKRVSCSESLEKIMAGKQCEACLDIADFLLRKDTPYVILTIMIERNPALQFLIDELDLELIE